MRLITRKSECKKYTGYNAPSTTEINKMTNDAINYCLMMKPLNDIPAYERIVFKVINKCDALKN